MISIDPGTNCTGLAAWHDGRLAFVKDIKAHGNLAWRTRTILGHIVDARIQIEGDSLDVVIEEPQLYRHTRSKTTADDLGKLSDFVDRIATELRFDTIIRVKPRAWKGQRPKDVCKRISRAALSPAELERVPRTLGFDGWDAIGLGLWKLGRAFR